MTCARFFRRARRWFWRQGISIPGAMTDIAKTYTTGAERFTQSELHRWAYKRPCRPSAQRNAAVPNLPDPFNLERPHRSPGGIPPALYFHLPHEQRP